MRLMPGFRYSRFPLALLVVAAFVVPRTAAGQGPVKSLGPRDGSGLSPLDTGRVAVGTVAPDFSLEAKDSGVVTLSRFRGRKNVILVFYRGHW